MKLILAFSIAVFCSLAAATENQLYLDDDLLYGLAHIDPNQLPTVLAEQVKDTSHWCCSNEQPAKLEQRTRAAKTIHVRTEVVKTGYVPCGFLDMMRCSVHTTKYRHEVVYHTETYEVPNENSCEDHHVKCCKGYLEVAGNCMSLEEIKANMDLLQELIKNGLISGIGK